MHAISIRLLLYLRNILLVCFEAGALLETNTSITILTAPPWRKLLQNQVGSNVANKDDI